MVLPLIVSLLVTAPAWGRGQEQQDAQKAAEQAAQAWLELTDAGKYAESWEASSKPFKAAVKKEQWVGASQTVRQALGKLASRKKTSDTYATSLPGAPDGEYVIIEYKSSFENQKTVTETVTLFREEDGKWRVLNYFVE